jgi:C-terminal processing protease CtpA/Prc
LKRFVIVFDYRDSVMYLKPGSKFKDPFEHDMSGMEYYADGENYKRIIVSRVEAGSPADIIGIERGDEIVAINFKPVTTMSIEEIDDIFKSGNDRNLLLDIYHDKKIDKVIITLKKRI